MKIEPLRDYLVLRLLPEPPRHGLIAAVKLNDRPSAHAEIVEVGPEVRDCIIGGRVIVSRLQGFQIDLGEPLVLVRESAVLAHLDAVGQVGGDRAP